MSIDARGLDGQIVLVIGRPSGIAAAIVSAARDIAARTERLGSVDHIVSTASARARGELAELDRDALRLWFDTKVIGPLTLAKHFASCITRRGSILIFAGVASAKIAVGTMGVAITNGSVEVLARSLAREMAPIRVNAISPGVIDTGAWDAFGARVNPKGRGHRS